MKWSRIKNIIILILAVANAFLLTLVVTREARSARFEREARASAVAILERSGVAVSEEGLPDDMALSPCRTERDRAAERALASALLGQTIEEERGGGVYRYRGDKGSVQFHSGGAFSATLTAGAYPLAEGQTMEAHAAALLKTLGLEGTVLRSEGGSVVLRQSWQGAPLINCTIQLNYEDGALRSITESQRLIGTPEPEGTVRALDVPTALIRFLNERNELGDVSTEITRMEAGYVVTAGLSGTARLTPVWRFETETGAYHMDAVTGAFSRAE